LSITRVIIHEIPQAKIGEKGDHPARLSEAVTTLDSAQRSYFERRIATSLSKAFEIQWDGGTSGSPVPAAIMDCFDDANYDETTFVEQSRLIAAHLHDKQLGGSPAGLLAVVEATILTGKVVGRCIVVLKLELESGVSVTATQDGQGRTVLAVQLEDVTLTETTRVFKAGLFHRFDSLEKLSGWVSDSQLDSATAGRVVAEFFLSGFLGCELRETDQIATMRFLTRSREFVNSVEHEEKKFRYLTAIRAEIESQASTIDPEAFANRVLDVEDRDNFVNRFMAANGTIPPIMKNVALVEREVSRTWVTFTDGVRVTGPPEAVQRVVEAIEEARNDNGDLIVTAQIAKVR